MDIYILNDNKSKVLINTGLIDKFMNDLYVCFDIEGNNYTNAEIVKNKIDLVRKGFSKDNLRQMPKMVKFYNKPEELIFTATIEDFDIEDSNRLNHIINERRNRFPEVLSKLSPDVLFSKLKAAIEKAIKISERDYKYVVPVYNSTEDTIQFLMPLHLDKSIEDTPELVLVVAKIEGFYTVMTILKPDDAYDNARVIARPDNLWLQPEQSV